MSKSTRITPEQLRLMGLEEYAPGQYRPKRKSDHPITKLQTMFEGNKTNRHELDEQGIIPSGSIRIIHLGEPKAQKRHRHFKGKGMSFTTTYDPSKTDKKNFLTIVQDNAPDKPFDQPLHLHIAFYFSRPKSHFRTGKNSHIIKDTAPLWHTGRPDVDNLFKFCTDALTKVYWRDDSLICSTSITKKYDDNPRTEITITPI